MSTIVKPHHLNAIENALGVDLLSPEVTRSIFSKLSWKKIEELNEALVHFEMHWTPPPSQKADTMHIGRAYYTLTKPKAWIPSQGSRDGPFDVDMLTRMLVYLPQVSVWLPAIEQDAHLFPSHKGEPSAEVKTQTRICGLAERLSAVRPFLDDGSVLIVPDRFYAELSNWQEDITSFTQLKHAVAASDSIDPVVKDRVAKSATEDDAYLVLREHFGHSTSWVGNLKFEVKKPSDMLLLARQEAREPRYREMLDQFDFFEGTEDLCSDSRYIWALREAEFIKYVNPLNEINEDQLIQALLGTSTLCADQRMFELLKRKNAAEAVRTNETAWANASVALPGIKKLSTAELISIRRNEEAFEVWRTTLSRAMRSFQQLTPGSNLEAEAQQIVREEIQPISMNLQNKIKSKTLKATLNSGAVSFGSSAIASYMINPNPTVSIATGAATSTLKLIYDLLESRGIKREQSLVRMFSVLTGIK